VFKKLVEAGMDLDEEELFGPPAAEVAERLASDYTTLFISPGDRILLYESIHREEDGSLMGESTVQVEGLISSLGLTIDDRWTDLPDHLSIELELMQKLAGAEAGFWDGSDVASATDCGARQQALLNDHIAAWVPTLFDAIEFHANTAFYRAVARLTRKFIEAEKRTLG
jgi:TorA maturation chaperone TorD